MNPLIRDILETLLRKGLTAVATYLVTVGLLTEGQATEVVTGLVLVGVSIAWSIYQRYKDRLILLTAIEAPPGTSEKQVKNLAKLPDAPSVMSVLIAAIVGASMVVVPACSRSRPPALTPVGVVAYDARVVIQAGEAALTVLEPLADQKIIPRTVALDVSRAVEAVGRGGKGLADALRIYKANVTPESWKTLHTALTSIQGIVLDTIAKVPDAAVRERVKGILQPILDALLLITLPPPPGTTVDLVEENISRLVAADKIMRW